ncbi:MAG: type II secretion system protein J, partial [Clostridiaceae bacterium]
MTIKHRKGITLIEILTSLFIFAILMSSLLSIFIFSYKAYLSSSKKDEDYAYLDQAFNILEYEINNDVLEVFASDNKITLKKNNDKNDYIILNGDILILIYSNQTFSPYEGYCSNKIIKRVSSFLVSKKNNILFIKIKLEGGVYIEKCIRIKIK